MSYTNLRDSVEKMRNQKDFQSNSLWGRCQASGIYRIYSYSTCLAEIKDGEIKYLNLQQFSVTTSKHQGYIRQALGGFPVAQDAEILTRKGK